MKEFKDKNTEEYFTDLSLSLKRRKNVFSGSERNDKETKQEFTWGEIRPVRQTIKQPITIMKKMDVK